MRVSRGARVLVAALAVAAMGLAATTAFAGGGFQGPTFGYGRYVREARAFRFCDNFARQPARYRPCLSDQALWLVEHTHDPARELPRIDRYAHSVGGFLNDHCHILMHPVGRRYARRIHLTLARLRDYLPRSNDPGCSAGFGHGLIMELGPQIVRMGPQGAAAACVRGIRVPALATLPLEYQVRLIRGCANVDHAAQHGCYSWLGEALNVIRNGGFAGDGCKGLTYEKTRAPRAQGARAYEGA